MMKCFIFLALVAVAANAAFAPVHIPKRDRIQGRYIVVLQDGVNTDSVIDRFNRDVTVEANVKTIFEAVLNGFVVEADKDGIALDLLQMLPGVKYIEEDSVVRAAGGQVEPTNSWGQDRIDQRDVQGDSRMILEGYGNETHIYIIDSGIIPDHPDFSGRAYNAKDVIGGDALTVASSDVDDRRSFFSNWGDCVDVFAPGTTITSLSLEGEPTTLSGTSMACAHAIGVASAIMENQHIHVGVIEKIKGNASMGKISDPKGSPNRLVYAGQE